MKNTNGGTRWRKSLIIHTVTLVLLELVKVQAKSNKASLQAFLWRVNEN